MGGDVGSPVCAYSEAGNRKRLARLSGLPVGGMCDDEWLDHAMATCTHAASSAMASALLSPRRGPGSRRGARLAVLVAVSPTAGEVTLVSVGALWMLRRWPASGPPLVPVCVRVKSTRAPAAFGVDHARHPHPHGHAGQRAGCGGDVLGAWISGPLPCPVIQRLAIGPCEHRGDCACHESEARAR